MYNFKHLYGYDHYIPADNLSKGFHGVLFGYLKKYHNLNQSILLAGENKQVEPIFSYYSYEKISYLSYYGNIGEKYEIDLNLPISLRDRVKIKDHDIVFCQALLEHTCRPSIVIENLARMTVDNGYILLHTHNRNMGEHKFPVDCCRFLPDFFTELQKYLPIEMVEYDEWDEHVFVCYRKVVK